MKRIINIALIQFFLVIVFIVLSVTVFSQENKATSTKKIAANTDYNQVGGFKKLMFGDHYRKEWATIVEVPVLDLETFAGGLTPMKLGGGMQTKSLRLTGENGKEYVLRSINKDPSKALVAELRGTFAEAIVQDQISSSNPYAPLVIASLSEAAGIWQNNPKIVYVPKSSRLGSFAAIFGETLCLLEDRPSDKDSMQIVNTQKLLEKVYANSDNRIDEKAFLKARLFDILIGDWDRHEDQWLWASVKEGGNTVYKPIPRDRDQAFSSLDGVIPQIITKEWGLRKLQNFDYRIKDLNGLATSGNHLDRSFTTQLTLKEWILVARQLQDDISDKVIAAAFEKMPVEIYNIAGKETAAKLKRRRDDLEKYAISYYKFLSEEIDVTGTKDKEFFEVRRLNNDSTQVVVFASNKNGRIDRVIYERTFHLSETKEIRLYGLDGNDDFKVKGHTASGILVRMIGGKGQDYFFDGSSVNGLSDKTKIYDDRNNKFSTGSETSKYLSNDTLKNTYNRKAFKYNWFAPVSKPGYNPDDGIYVGGGFIFKKQGFGKAPYASMHTLTGNYALKTGASTFSYQGIFKDISAKWDLQLDASINAPNYSRNYFGMGNETVIENKDKNYYRVRFNEMVFGSSFRKQFASKHTFEFGFSFQSVKLENNDGRFIATSNAKLDSTDFDRKNYGRAHVNYLFTTVNNSLYPTKGIRFTSGAMYSQNVKDYDQRYIQLTSEFSTYGTIGHLTLATRTGFATNLGDDYELYQANTLSGVTNLRGYRKDRFAGKTSLYHNTELRYAIGNMNAYFVQGKWGILGFADNGRVWMPGESSSVWHHGYGAGVWFLPFNMMALTATYGVSKEDKIINVKAGFLF